MSLGMVRRPSRPVASQAFMISAAMAAVALDVSLARVGYGLILPAIRRDMAASYASAGIPATVHFAGYLVGSLIAQQFLRRDPPARATAVLSHAAVALMLLWSAFAVSIAQLACLRFVMGVGCGVGLASVVVASLERAPTAARSRVSTLTWSGIGAGLALCSPFIPWVLAGEGRWREATLAVAGVAAFVAVALFFALTGEPGTSPAAAGEARFQLIDLVKPRRYLFLAIPYTMFGLAYSAYVTYIVAAMRSHAFSPFTVAVVWTSLGIATVVGSVATGPLLSSPLRQWILALCLGVAALGAAISVSAAPVRVVSGALLVGLGLAAVPGIVTAFSRDRSSRETSAAAFVAVTTTMSTGAVLGPLLAGLLADRVGSSWTALFAAYAYAAGTVAALCDGATSLQSAVPANALKKRRRSN
jgi:predicted MFS family arabinose efflux permease